MKKEGTPPQAILNNYLEWGKHRGWSEGYSRTTRVRMNWWVAALSMNSIKELEDRSIVAKAEDALQKYSTGKSFATLNTMVQTIKAFSSWAYKRGYLDSNPLSGMEGYKFVATSKRRALTRQEISTLFHHCRPERKLLYQLAIYTGYRAGELSKLKVKSFTGTHLILDGRHTKNRKPACQPLPDFLQRGLRRHCQNMDKEDCLVIVPAKPSESLQFDLKRAGIEFQNEEGKVDFHSLRVTFVTLLDEMGLSAGEMMALARHSTPDLTLGTYTKPGHARIEKKMNAMEGGSDDGF